MIIFPVASQKTSHIRMTLNGEQVDVSFAPYKTLLEVLREDLGHTGTKHGCELGECGACAVLLDGKPVLSCLVLGVECDARNALTVEGLGLERTLHPLQDAFADPCWISILMRVAIRFAQHSPASCAGAPDISRFLRPLSPPWSRLRNRMDQRNSIRVRGCLAPRS